MSNANLVSIIMPTYNCGHLIPRAINSVISQSFKNWELIIIDNCSNDNTQETIKNFNDQRITSFKINNNGIIAASRNKGIEVAKGEWIAFLDADDWWTKDKLQISVNTLNKGFDFVYHDLYKFYEKNFFFFSSKVKTTQVNSPVYKFLLENGNVITNSSVVLKTSIIRKINCISEDESLIAAEDFDCWLRFASETERFKRLEGCHGFYWIGENNTSSAKKTATSLKTIIKNHYGKLNEPAYNNFNISELLYSIIKSLLILRNYNEAKFYNKIIKKFPVKRSLRLKLFFLRLFGYMNKLSK